MHPEEKGLSGSMLGLNEDIHNEAVMSSIPPKDHPEKQGTVSINNIDPQVDPTDCQNVLEFFLTTISQAMALSPKQSAGLLSNNNKYLVHV
jgi:hypothetical protein